MLRGLERTGAAVTVFPPRAPVSEILSFKPDGVLISNGPADPRALKYAVEIVRSLMGRTPLMGICPGRQLMELALGGECVRLKSGHHGCDHPVKNLEPLWNTSNLPACILAISQALYRRSLFPKIFFVP